MPFRSSRRCARSRHPLLSFFGIRLDSGDLAYLSKKARIMLDEAGFPDAVISASSDLDEVPDQQPDESGCRPSHSWGVGTNLITSKDCPSFGGVYKLACIINEDGTEIPKIKVSENVEKVTNPGNKKILRIYDKTSGKIKADLITLEDEVFTGRSASDSVRSAGHMETYPT